MELAQLVRALLERQVQRLPQADQDACAEQIHHLVVRLEEMQEYFRRRSTQGAQFSASRPVTVATTCTARS